ncbi:L-threonine synthase [Thermodesulfitimonas autotrophica]|uniref:Threonine synthase n=1 Tax=Thermodesulfitimonas autotrophica TaxID=1894989 RepID=A0A3N5AXY0_9THEO|nr:threonine synthase [Thermodesulfitimonas autotrophica]RPF49817.1 L-threonine synthase [Thermodesulfitimonas autotrophica]
MYYESTRGEAPRVTAAAAIVQGIAPDGGLYVPAEFPAVALPEIAAFPGLSYQERAARIITPFLENFTPAEIRACIGAAYNTRKFAHPAIAPLKSLGDGSYILELWHGPTYAFKDMALQLMPHLLVLSRRKTGNAAESVILVATSGDTGKAALEGFRDVPGTRIIVFFPAEGVSEMQKRQMVTQEGNNTYVVGVAGNFDDAQSGVKEIFTDPEMRARLKAAGFEFSSANSINWGRLLPQIVYYFSAYADLLAIGGVKSGEPVNFVVPTGNFGNILAGFYARLMGLPVKRLVLAANANNVLTDFVRTGIYDRRRPFYKTISPSMDILISSNLERLLYALTGRDAAAVRNWMGELKERGVYRVPEAVAAQVREIFWSDWADDATALATIKETFRRYGYLLDPHTAVAVAVYARYRATTEDGTPSIILSTASPFKFNRDVACAVIGEEAAARHDEFALLEILARETGWPVPEGLRTLAGKPVRHRRVVQREEMKKVVAEILGI